MSNSEARTPLTRTLYGYYWFFRPILAVAYVGLLLAGRRVAHPLDIVMLLTLWLLPLWVRKRLLPAAQRRDPGFAARLSHALSSIDTERAKSALPWVRARP